MNLVPFQEFLSRFPEGCSVVFVGNAPSLSGAALGSWIDSHDVVVRFNECPTKGYTHDVGTRTDILVSNPYPENREPFSCSKRGMVVLIAPQTRRQPSPQLESWLGDIPVLFTYTPDLVGINEECAHTAGLTTGTYGIHLLSKLLAPSEVSITGFTMFLADKSHHYWSPKTPKGVRAHDFTTEASVFISICNGIQSKKTFTSDIFWVAEQCGRSLSPNTKLKTLPNFPTKAMPGGSSCIRPGTCEAAGSKAPLEKPQASVFHFGTFDVFNYGDLLFPLLVRHMLKSFDLEFTHISPAGPAPRELTDCVPTCGAKYAMANAPIAAGAIIGGGNIIHCRRTSLSAYQEKHCSDEAYANLWLTPSFFLPKNVPIVWNAPGVPASFDQESFPMVRHALERASYLSVRDESSRQFLLEVWPEAPVKVVPDSAWHLPLLWDKDVLAIDHRRILATHGYAPSTRTVVFHVNQRYLGQKKPRGMAACMSYIASKLDAVPILLPLGPCHGDDVLMKEICGLMKNKAIFHIPTSLREVAACIGLSHWYIGSSMHGLITASAFCVPATSVSNTAMPKFAGIMELTGLPDIVVNTWDDAVSVVETVNVATRIEQLADILTRVQQDLVHHWAAMLKELKTTPS